jgi:parallel beta-helix repeat protein
MAAKLRLYAALATPASLGVIVVFAVAGATALGGGRALASHVSCGDTITTDTTLDSDLADCPNNGIVIGADDITLDLNGHLIDGDGTPAAGCDPETEFCDVGVVNDGHDGVTVMHGSMREFDIGPFVFGVRHNRVLGISSSRNRFSGILVVESARSLVRGSSGNRNPAPDGDGMGLFGSHDVRILHNSFRHNARFGPGLHVEDSTDNLIKGNVFSRNPDVGMSLDHADRNRVRRNRCVRNGEACIRVGSGNRNVIARNRIFRDGSGVGIEKGRGNLVARNVVARARNEGIYLGIPRPLIGGGNNTVRRNRVRGSGAAGFEVNEKDDHSLLRRNHARHSGGDGFDVQSRTTKLTGNSAVRNADLGIRAVAGVTDGGGNVARHNGGPRRCTHVICHVTRR